MSVLRKLFFAVSRCLVLLHFFFLQVFDWALTSLHLSKWFLRKRESETANAASRLRLYFLFTILEKKKQKIKNNQLKGFLRMNAVSHGNHSLWLVPLRHRVLHGEVLLVWHLFWERAPEGLHDVASDRNMDCFIAWAISLKPIIALYWCKRRAFIPYLTVGWRKWNECDIPFPWRTSRPASCVCGWGWIKQHIDQMHASVLD